VKAALAVGLLALAAAAPAAARPPAYVQVTETEYRLALSRLSVRAGPAIVEVVNFGMDPHDLVLQGRGRGSKPRSVETLEPRGRADLEVRLAPGRYDLWCSLPGHRERGMRAVLVVRR
jgi:hypothetical protein